MVWLASLLAGFLILRFIVVAMNASTRIRLKEAGNKEGQLVSVLIPARNEENNLPVLLQSIQRQQYENFEVIVYDDLSEDNTAKVAEHFSRIDPRISWIKGIDLPEGWLGKSYACHNLAARAKGRYYLFLDADVVTGPALIRSAIHHFTSGKLKLLSIFPDQTMVSAGEKSTVPFMNWVLLTLLPLALIKRSRLTAFSAANGQFMLFEAEDYDKNQYHQRVKRHPVEDILIMKSMKHENKKTATLLGNRHITCRMYHGRNEAIHGFSKNIIEFFGGSFTMLWLYNFITSFGLIVVAIGWNLFYALGYLSILILMKITVSLLSNQSISDNLIYWLPLHFSQLSMSALAIRNRIAGTFTWKGRKIKI